MRFLDSITELQLPGIVLFVLLLLVVAFSSYVKLATVLSIVRAGLGVFSLPAVFVTGILAFVLSLVVMSPVVEQAALNIDEALKTQGGNSGEKLELKEGLRLEAIQAGFEPFLLFAKNNAHPAEVKKFAALASKIDAQLKKNILKSKSTEEKKSENPEVSVPAREIQVPIDEPSAVATQATVAHQAGQKNNEQIDNSFRVIAPAFLVSELKEAFSTGLTLFLPFLVIELIVANILVAVGLNKLSPEFVSFPLKLLLFVLADGWSLITTNLLETYLR